MWFPFVDVHEARNEETEQELLLASYRVLDELKTARFEVHAHGPYEGLPVDPMVGDAIKLATIKQVEFWRETGNPSGAATQMGGGSILSVTLPGGQGTTSIAEKQASRVSPEVVEILRACPGIRWEVGYT